MNNTELMREYVDVVSGRQLNESISSEMIDIIERRMQKTVTMVNHLINDLGDDEAPDTIEDLKSIVEALTTAIINIEEVRSSWNYEIDNVADGLGEEVVEPGDEPIDEPVFKPIDPIMTDPEIPNFMRRQAE